MKILHTVESYSPSVGGMQEVVKQLSERLVKLGHEVTVATRKQSDRQSLELNGVKIEEFDIAGGMVQGYKGDILPYEKFLQTPEFDIITNFAAQQWATDIALPILDKIPAKKVFVPTGFSALNNPLFVGYFAKMPEWMKKYDMNIFLSNDYQDINFAREHKIKKISIIPNGAGQDEFNTKTTIDIRKKYNIKEDDFLILNVGSHTGAKGHHEAIQIFKGAKIKNATFLIIGNNPQSPSCLNKCKNSSLLFNLNLNQTINKKRLIIADLKREETVAAYKSADLFLFPSNIECSPIVLFECMASKTPFLTTKVGNAAEIIDLSNSGILLPTLELINHPNRFADVKKSIPILEEIYKNKKQRQNLARNGFEAWVKKFSWEKISLQYESLYFNLLNND